MAESQTVIASLAFHPVDRMLVIASYNELHFWDWSQPEPFAKCFTANEREKVRSVSCNIVIYMSLFKKTSSIVIVSVNNFKIQQTSTTIH